MHKQTIRPWSANEFPDQSRDLINSNIHPSTIF